MSEQARKTPNSHFFTTPLHPAYFKKSSVLRLLCQMVPIHWEFNHRHQPTASCSLSSLMVMNGISDISHLYQPKMVVIHSSAVPKSSMRINSIAKELKRGDDGDNSGFCLVEIRKILATHDKLLFGTGPLDKI